jgi:LuxR family transcriptional regulator, glucitol operon activator
MSYSASRLTLYALLSSIEEDLRDLIQMYLDAEAKPEALLDKELLEKCQKRLAKDQSGPLNPEKIADLLVYADFADLIKLLNTHKSRVPASITEQLGWMNERIDKLLPIRNRVAHLRPLDYDDLAVTLDISEEFVRRDESLWKETKTILARLKTDQSFVLQLRIPFYEYESVQDKHNLPLPDFDETGFIGRRAQVADLVRICLGPFPVISIVGEGGLGKTALATKVAYEILDLPSCPFDAVVFTSSKTKQLTPQEIINIGGAIRDSLGMLQDVANQLSGTNPDNPLNEVLSYLENFKILLILDNLETVLDERIKEFLSRLPSGSKILITSRIGVGAYENPIRLSPMDKGEAIQLIRALAKIRGVQGLERIDNPHLGKYCERMHNNPGYIKWFVSAIQTGKRPEEVLSASGIFLDYCMSNVYDYLDEVSRKILRSMLVVLGKRSQAELSFLNEIEALELQKGLQQLLTTNMVVMSSNPKRSPYETEYDLSELSREYLTRHHPIQQAEYAQIIKRKKELDAAKQEIQEGRISDTYSYLSITTRSSGDLITAKYLIDAIYEIRKRDFAEADRLIDRACSLAPSNFEVYRVRAYLKAEQGDYSGAQLAYETAIELEPNQAPLRSWYGGFLSRYVDDWESAHQQLLEAARIDPSALTVQLELARIKLVLKKFDEAEKIIEILKQRPGKSVWGEKMLYDLILKFHQRKAEFLLSQHDNHGALKSLLELRSTYKQCPRNLLDNKMTKRLSKAILTAAGCIRFLESEEDKTKAREVREWLSDTSEFGI